ncbi:MAG TPA: 2-C-methyl-D-erythritol 4-phosphate cytidylyltransferase [Nocardioides sp.]|uniref:2-C-methyl-D-erythritol 4-phosphate cytidylyltransferase n=1 Tax=Nocardioides sp. TaxID=35761 RepID=UPI002F4291D3
MEDLGPVAWGVVVERDRGSLPFALLHGEPLVACAAWAMGEAGIQLLDLTTPWETVRHGGMPLVWHDALCPMAPPDFLAACVRRSVIAGVVVAGVLPVTDTVKEVEESPDGPVVGTTHDRDGLRRLATPLVLPAALVSQLEDWPSADLRVALADLRARHEVELMTAPTAARRVHDAVDVAALEALTGR